jgi:hypothetical protein
VTAKLAELQESVRLIDHKIDDRSSVAAEAASQLWAPIPSRRPALVAPGATQYSS